jgi:hypothetical protein
VVVVVVAGGSAASTSMGAEAQPTWQA